MMLWLTVLAIVAAAVYLVWHFSVSKTRVKDVCYLEIQLPSDTSEFSRGAPYGLFDERYYLGHVTPADCADGQKFVLTINDVYFGSDYHDLRIEGINQRYREDTPDLQNLMVDQVYLDDNLVMSADRQQSESLTLIGLGDFIKVSYSQDVPLIPQTFQLTFRCSSWSECSADGSDNYTLVLADDGQIEKIQTKPSLAEETPELIDWRVIGEECTYEAK